MGPARVIAARSLLAHAGVILRASSTAIAATASGSIVNPRLSVLLARADVEILKSSLRIYPETSMTWLITATVMVLPTLSISVTITRLYASSFDRGLMKFVECFRIVVMLDTEV